MKSEKELDREYNKAMSAKKDVAWANEEIELTNQLLKKSAKKIQKLGAEISKGKRKIRGYERKIKIFKDFDKQLDKEFDEIYGK